MATKSKAATKAAETTEEIAQLGQPCPPPGGSATIRQMSSTVTLSMTDYQYWHMKMHGNSTTIA
jgi:hypothetical protein